MTTLIMAAKETRREGGTCGRYLGNSSSQTHMWLGSILCSLLPPADLQTAGLYPWSR